MTIPSALPFIKPRDQLEGVAILEPVEYANLHSFGRIVSAYESPAQASVAERVFLYALTMARRPARILEIGFRFGGTSFLMLCALDDVNSGRLVSIDPEPDPALDFSGFGDRFHLVRGRSPGAVPEAVARLGGLVDLCFVDGSHELDAVLADLEAVRPHMAGDSYLVLHDARSPGVQTATEEFLARHRRRVSDCGFVVPDTNAMDMGGMRMLHFHTPSPGLLHRMTRRVRRFLSRPNG